MKDDQSPLVIVYNAPNMVAANMVRGLLSNAKIPAIIRSLQIPMYNDIALMQNPVWGQILVPKKWEEEAKNLVADYLRSIE